MSNVSKDDPEKPMTVKLVILGKSLVGKSALTYRYICDKFPNEHDTTVEDQYKVNMTIEGIKCEVEILDTAGQDDYQTMLDTWIENGNCYLLVYSIDDSESFTQVKIRYERISQIKNTEPFSVLLVGNKCDLPESSRKINNDEVEKYAKSNGLEYLETSALKTINVKEAFTQVVHDYLLKTKFGGNQKAGTCCPCF